ncbi:hypothetical protein Taro_012651 [Colocasia esculenta]|uniref:Uncharacterized protein n=1 Tax=Colocasia esculenta TaxID=4460 RepID=A0A843UGC7_COLES|nr:hypothetical protein [Colocasia esculenta]
MGRASSSFTMSNTRSSHYPLFAAASFLFLLILICSSSSSPFTAAAAVEEDPCSSNYALASAPPSMLPPTKLEEMEEANSSATDVLINPHDQPPQLPAAARQQRRVPKAQTLPLKQGASQSSQLLLDFGRQQPSCLYHMTFKTSCYSPTPVNDLEFALDIRDVYGSDVLGHAHVHP